MILSLLFTMFSAQALPYSVDKIKCNSEQGSIILRWDHSKSLWISSILVNGKEEAGGSTLTSENKTDTYAKENVFSITINPAHIDRLKAFEGKGSIGNQPATFTCSYNTKWHLY